MNHLTIGKKLIKLACTVNGVVDRLGNDRITTDHFIDQEKSKESVLLSRIFGLIKDYFDQSSGSLMTSQVFNGKISNSNLKDTLKTEVISLWMDCQDQQVTESDLHFLMESIKQLQATKVLDSALESLQDDLVEKGTREAVIAAQFALDKVLREYESFDSQKLIIDMTKRAEEFKEEYIYRLKNKDKFTGIPSGIPEIDEATLGWFPGQLITFLAPSAGGKSVQLLNCAIAAHLYGKKVLYFSFEMDVWHCELRTISNMFNVPYHKLKSQNMSDQELNDMFTAYHDISGPYFEYDVSCEDPIPEYMESRIRELAMGGKGMPELVVADYVGKMKTRESRRDAKPWENAGDAAVKLGVMAKKYNIPILTAQQINRDILRENRKKREEGKSTAFYQDAISGDQRLAHESWYMIGIEPDKENKIATYHPVKMRDAHFDPIIAATDPSTFKVIPLNTEDQHYWKVVKGFIKDETTVVTSTTKKPMLSHDDMDDDDLTMDMFGD